MKNIKIGDILEHNGKEYEVFDKNFLGIGVLTRPIENELEDDVLIPLKEP